MKKSEMKQSLRWAKAYREQVALSCGVLGHPRPDWVEDVERRFWTRKSCPCGKTGTDGTNRQPALVIDWTKTG